MTRVISHRIGLNARSPTRPPAQLHVMQCPLIMSDRAIPQILKTLFVACRGDNYFKAFMM